MAQFDFVTEFTHFEVVATQSAKRSRNGGPAHRKLARIVYAVITTPRPYQAQLHTKAEQRRLAHSLQQLRAKAKKLGFELTSIQQTALYYLTEV